MGAFLSEPASSLTDLALGAVVLVLALRLAAVEGVHRYWRLTFLWSGGAALAGAVHHGLITHDPELARASWALVSCAVVVAISYLLAATVEEVLGPGNGRAFWLLRSASLGAYAGFVLTGNAGVEAILLCEGATMVAVLGLWGWAAWRRHPLAQPVLVALLASGAAGAIKAAPPEWTAVVGLDPTSLYHVAQIPGMVLLFLALARGDLAAAPEPQRRTA